MAAAFLHEHAAVVGSTLDDVQATLQRLPTQPVTLMQVGCSLDLSQMQLLHLWAVPQYVRMQLIAMLAGSPDACWLPCRDGPAQRPTCSCSAPSMACLGSTWSSASRLVGPRPDTAPCVIAALTSGNAGARAAGLPWVLLASPRLRSDRTTCSAASACGAAVMTCSRWRRRCAGTLAG